MLCFDINDFGGLTDRVVEDSPAEVDNPVVEEVRNSEEGVDHSFGVVVVRNPAAVDIPHALGPERMTCSGAQVRPEEASKARDGRPNSSEGGGQSERAGRFSLA